MRPFDLDRRAGELLAFAQQAAERHRLARRQAWLAHQFLGHQLRGGNAVRAGVAMALAAGVDGAQEAVLATARCGRAPPRPARWPSRGPRWRRSASGLRRFRSSRRRRRARRSAAGSARPSRCRPATGRGCPCSGAHARSTAPPSRRAPRSRIRFRRKGRGSFRTGRRNWRLCGPRSARRNARRRARLGALFAPGGEQRREDVRRDRLLVEREPNLRSTACAKWAGRPSLYCSSKSSMPRWRS